MFPFAIAAGLAAAGGYLIWSSSAPGARREIVSEDHPTDWRALGLIALALLVHLLLLKSIGFILVSAGLFAAVAVAFGSRHYLRDGAIGLVLGTVTYLGFTRLLGLQLPPGILAGVM
jgi:putative tricarboxylic transport membrane protein